MSRKPTQQEIQQHVKQQRAQQGAATGRYLDARDVETVRRQSPELRAQQAAIEQQSQERWRLMEQARQRDEADQKERDKARREQIEAELADVKEREYKVFRANHPDLTRTDFERKVWPVRRDELTGRESQVEAAKQSLLNSKLYNF